MMIDAEMYGMIPSAKTVKRDKAPTREHVEQVQDAALLATEQLLQLHWIDAWHRDMRPDAIHDQRKQQKNQRRRKSPNLPVFAI
jgi:hypothetical protein